MTSSLPEPVFQVFDCETLSFTYLVFYHREDSFIWSLCLSQRQNGKSPVILIYSSEAFTKWQKAFSPNDNSPDAAEQQSCVNEPELRQRYPSGERMDIDDCHEEQRQKPNEVILEAQLADLKTQLQERDHKLKELEERCEMMSKGTLKKEQKLKELQDKCDNISKDADKKDQDVIKFRKLWKKAAMEHDKLRASGQGFYQMTDEYLVELINHLRLVIRDFSIQYFDGIALKKDFFTYRPSYIKHLERTTSDRDGFLWYMGSPTQSHEIIQAFLWRVIVSEIFNKFEWLGAETSAYYLNLRDVLQSCKSRNHHDLIQLSYPFHSIICQFSGRAIATESRS